LECLGFLLVCLAASPLSAVVFLLLDRPAKHPEVIELERMYKR
jgi:hypothetical protein